MTQSKKRMWIKLHIQNRARTKYRSDYTFKEKQNTQRVISEVLKDRLVTNKKLYSN